jgi:hypothetical protein
MDREARNPEEENEMIEELKEMSFNSIQEGNWSSSLEEKDVKEIIHGLILSQNGL